MSYFGVPTRNGAGLGIGSVPSLRPSTPGDAFTMGLNFIGTSTLDPRITFSRGSNATLTGSDGLIQYAPHNLLTYSEQFDNAAWTKNQATITANATTAPDGTVSADLITVTGTTDSYAGQLFATTSTVTHSCYFKAGNNPTVKLRAITFGTVTDKVLLFNTSTLVFTGDTTDFLSYGYVPLSNGWFRIYATRAGQSGQTSVQTRISGAEVNGATAYIWGAQLNVGSLQPYYPTTVKNLLGYTQEFDNAAWSKSNSFVQTNLLTYSEQFDNAAWTKENSTITANAILSPTGTLTADKLVETSATGIHSAYESVSGLTDSTVYTATVYAKAAERTQLVVGIMDKSATTKAAVFDLSAGTATTSGVTPASSYSITSVGDGWYRCSVSNSVGTGAVTPRHYNFIYNGATSYTGDPTKGLYIWGAQLVQGSTAGDYQVTYGAAAAVAYTAPDGSLTADKIVPTTTSGDHLVSANAGTATSGTVYTLSVYAKAAGYNFVRLSFGNTAGGGYTFFDLLNGTIGTTGGMLSSSITPVGNGWYRCSVQRAAGSTALFGGDIYVTSANAQFSWAGDGTSGVYIWGAQLSDSASLDPYVYNPVAAPSAAAYYGPRFDYDPVTLQPKGLLVEEQRTNLLTYSEQFDNAAWGKENCSITANSSVAPDGTNTADTLVRSGTGSSRIAQSISATTTLTASVYAKAGTQNFLNVQINTALNINAAFITFNLTNGSVGASTNVAGSLPLTGTAVAVGGGWYRCSVSFVSTTDAVFRIGAANAANTRNGDDGGTIYIWGAQIEAGAFPTSYIPTTSAQVTRAADVALMQGANFSNWYNASEGTLYGEFAIPPGLSAFPNTIGSISDGTTNNTLTTYAHTSGVYTTIRTNGVSQGDPGVVGSPVVSSHTKYATTYQLNNCISAWNGTLGVVDTSVTLPIPNQLRLGVNGAGQGQINSHIKRLAYYQRRLSNSELQSITS